MRGTWGEVCVTEGEVWGKKYLWMSCAWEGSLFITCDFRATTSPPITTRIGLASTFAFLVGCLSVRQLAIALRPQLLYDCICPTNNILPSDHVVEMHFLETRTASLFLLRWAPDGEHANMTNVEFPLVPAEAKTRCGNGALACERREVYE